jgi:hypothetical protein
MGEAERQQLLLQTLWRAQSVETLRRQLRDDGLVDRGLAAYQAAAGALAQRALAAAYPVVQALMGEASFAALARAFWQTCAPVQGDMALWGESLALFIQQSAQLASEPYLSDVARLEWAVHQAQTAADETAPTTGLQRLTADDRAGLRVRARAGTTLVSSAHPVHSVWQAHQDSESAADRFAPVRAAFAQGLPEHALVYRAGYRVSVLALPSEQATFTAAVLSGLSLGDALQQAHEQFEFEPWLICALRHNWIVSIT